MKKQLFAAAALCAVLGLSACGTDSGSSQGTVPAETTTAAAETTTSAAQTTTSAAETTTSAAPDTTTAAATTAAAEKDSTDIAVLTGEWKYQKREQTLTDDWNPIDLGLITVSAGGIYTYEPLEGSKQTGSITLIYEEYSSGDRVPYFSFKDESGEYFIGCYCNQNEKDVYYLGNGGEERIVRKGSSADTYPPDTETPNQWGYTAVKELPANGVSAGILNGKWQNTQDDSETITFRDCERCSGFFTLENHAEYVQGKVVLEYNMAPDDTTRQYWFNLYRTNGEIYKTLAVPQEIPADTLYPQTQDVGYYTRVTE